MAPHDRPTPKQQAFLRSLAQSTGTSFTPPTTKWEASAEIKRLKNLERSSRQERQADRQAVQRAPRGGATRVDAATETTGYGSNAHWKGARAAEEDA